MISDDLDELLGDAPNGGRPEHHPDDDDDDDGHGHGHGDDGHSDDGGPSNGGRRSRRNQAGQRRPAAVPKLVAILVVVAGLLAGGIYGAGKVIGRIAKGESAADFAGPGDGSVIIQIQAGSTARDIARVLASADVVRTPAAFVNAAAADERSRSIQPGFYKVKQRVRAVDALAALLDARSHALFRLTIAEGMTTRQVLTALADRTGQPLAALEALVKNPGELQLPSYASGVEGYLYPFTYDLQPGASLTATVKMFVDRFRTETASLDIEAGAAALGRTPQDVITVASIIEREVKNPEEGPKVARVIYNRLADTSGAFRRLDLDSTTRYALNEYEGPLTQNQLNANNPYNTRKVSGLPPGAISNPGRWALESALHPAAGPWMYFVSLPKSNVTIFATTDKEWQEALARYRSEGGS
ncbi:MULTISPECIES: endolytic transglycosylase MltG [unclassified Frankia]|uniref:endolytic transglycosylase MltG n=1 Tax=unclassified Frankia TaxID=2632575 RepID=UPI002AD2BC35|nr:MULTISPECIES: endolytic transglycosylase MltG [unclassified Frankia]